MPTLKEITDDLKLVIQRNELSDDFRITTEWLQRLINKYRARGIRETFLRNREINQTWVQELGNIKTTKVTSDDDPNISGCDCIFGKFTIPTPVYLPSDKGVYRVGSACKTKKYFPTTIERFMYFSNDSFRANHKYYFRIGNAIYMAPFIKDASIQMIMEDPFDGFVLNTENISSGNLIVGESYQVVSGSIVHNSTTYTKDEIFTAANTTFTGNGVVQFENQKKSFTNTDQYPVDDTMLEYIFLKILGQELRIEERKIADIRNDAQDESERLQPKA